MPNRDAADATARRRHPNLTVVRWWPSPVAVWLIILAEYAAAAALAYGLLYLLATSPTTAGSGGNAAVSGVLLVGAAAVIAGGLVAAPIVHAVLGRRDRRNPKRPPPHGPWGAGTRAVGWGCLWGVLGSPVMLCLGLGVVKLLSSISSG